MNFLKTEVDGKKQASPTDVQLHVSYKCMGRTDNITKSPRPIYFMAAVV